MILIAGIGNIFLGDDGWGVEVARRLAERPRPAAVKIRDFGIRGMDLAFALMDPWDAVIMVDAAQRGHAPGTVSLIEASVAAGELAMDTHGWEPDKVLALAQGLGASLPPVYVVACEPDVLISGENNPDVLVALSLAVQAAVEAGINMVEDLVGRLIRQVDAVHA